MENTLNKSEIIKAAARAAMRHLCIPYKIAIEQVAEAFALAEKLALTPCKTAQQIFLRLRQEINDRNNEARAYQARRSVFHFGNRACRRLTLD